MRNRYSGRTILVVGGNSGIGLASAKAFADEGGRVAITGRNLDTLEMARREIGGDTLAISADTGMLADIDRVAGEVRRVFSKLDVLFYNAGGAAFSAIEHVSEADWDSLMAVNLKGAFFTIQKLLPLMPVGAAILITSSIAWKKAIPGSAVYATGKAGIHALGKALAAELAPRGIRVNVISPGPIETPLIDRTGGLPPEAIPATLKIMSDNTMLKRMGTSEEVAAAALFLASPEASFVTGADLFVDGGAAGSP